MSSGIRRPLRRRACESLGTRPPASKHPASSLQAQPPSPASQPSQPSQSSQQASQLGGKVSIGAAGWILTPPQVLEHYDTRSTKTIKNIPAKHPNNCLYAFEVADCLPLARAYLSLQTGCLLLVRLNTETNTDTDNISIRICLCIFIGICICIRSVSVSVSVSVIIWDHLGSSGAGII